MLTTEKLRSLASKILAQKGDPEEIELVRYIISLAVNSSDYREVEQAAMTLDIVTKGMRQGVILMALLIMLDAAIDQAIDYMINMAHARTN